MAIKMPAVGEVAAIVGVRSHTVRFWTEKFGKYLSHSVSDNGRKYYDQKSINILKAVKYLMHTKGLKIQAILDQDILAKITIDNNDLNEEELNGILFSGKTSAQPPAKPCNIEPKLQLVYQEFKTFCLNIINNQNK